MLKIVFKMSKAKKYDKKAIYIAKGKNEKEQSVIKEIMYSKTTSLEKIKAKARMFAKIIAKPKTTGVSFKHPFAKKEIKPINSSPTEVFSTISMFNV